MTDNMKKIIYPLLLCFCCMVSCEIIGERPTLGEIAIDEVAETTIECHAIIIAGEIADCGIYYGTTKNQVTNGTSKKVKGEYCDSVIRGKITGLSPNKDYYIKIYGMNEFGSSETEVTKVKTAPRTPSIDDNKFPDTQP